MLKELINLIRLKQYNKAIDYFFFNVSSFGESTAAATLNAYVCCLRLRDQSIFNKFYGIAEKINEDKYLHFGADARYARIFHFILPEKAIGNLYRLHDEQTLDDTAFVQLDQELYKDSKLLEKLLKNLQEKYRTRYDLEYKYLRYSAIEFFPYKYFGEFYKPEIKKNISTISKLSFIYCVKNRSSRALISLKTLNWAIKKHSKSYSKMDFEVIVVEDEGVDLIKNLDDINFGCDVHHYVVNTGLEWTRSGLLNFGIKKASGNILCFCDVDFLFPNDFFEINALSINTFDFSKNMLVVNCLESHNHIKDSIKYSQLSPYGYMWICDSRLTKKIGGFSEDFTGHGFEDRDFQQRMQSINKLGIVNSYSINFRFVIFHYSHNARTGDANRVKNRNLFQSKLKDKAIVDKNWGVFPVVSISSKLLNCKSVQMAFLAHNNYHAWTSDIVIKELKKQGITAIVISPLPSYQDEGCEKYCIDNGVDYCRAEQLLNGQLLADSLVVYNDWDQKVARPLVEHFNNSNKPTIGFIEGINDYNDIDTGRNRRAYRTVTNLLLPGVFDLNTYFKDFPGSTHVVGVPRIFGKIAPIREDINKDFFVLINANFTYGVLENFRDQWVGEAVLACEKLGYKYFISKHHADKGDYSKYNLSSNSFYDLLPKCGVLISRFSSCILEALVYRVPVVYYNPGFEKVIKFQDSMGAYQTPKTFEELLVSLKYTRTNVFPVDNAIRFLESHWSYSSCDINDVTKSLMAIYDKNMV